MPPEIRIRVAAVLIEEEKILLIQHRKNDSTYWLLPGGGVEPAETMHAALTRELKEETGLEIAPGALRFVCESIAPDAQRHIVHMAFAATRTGGMEIVADDPRIVGLAWHPLGALRTLPLYPALGEAIYTLLTTPEAPAAYLGQRWV